MLRWAACHWAWPTSSSLFGQLPRISRFTWADVVVDESLSAYRLRKEMESVFAAA